MFTFSGLIVNETALTEVSYKSLKLATAFKMAYPRDLNISLYDFQFEFSLGNSTFKALNSTDVRPSQAKSVYF